MASHANFPRQFNMVVSAVAALLVILILTLIVPHPLWSIGRASYVLLHTFLESVAIVVAVAIFTVGWSTPSKGRSRHTVLLSSVFLAVAILDFCHTLSFTGMPDFISPNQPDKTLDFWLAARLLAAAAVFAVALLPWEANDKGVHGYWMLAGALAFSAAIAWLVLFHPELSPRTFIPGQGLTGFTVGLQYFVIGLNILSAVLFYRHMRTPQPYDALSLFAAASIMAQSEVFSILYTPFTDIFNLLGHIYKVIAYLFLCWGIFIDNIRAPYQQLYQTMRALWQSEARLDRIVRSAMDAIITVDEKHSIVLFNPAAEAMFRCAAAAVLGVPLERFIPARYRAAYREQIERFNTTGEAAQKTRANEIIYGLRTDGEEFPMEVSISQAAVHGDKLFTLILRDSSERMHAEAALRESEQRLELALKGANLGLWDWNIRTGEVIFDRHWAAKVLGYTPDEIEPHIRSREKLVHPEDWPEVMEILHAHLKGKTPFYQTEHRVQAKSGEWKWILASGKVFERDPDGKPLRMVGAYQDVSERKCMELERRQLASVVEGSSNFISIADTKWRPLFLNKAGQQFVGVEGMEAVRQTVMTDYFVLEEQPFVREVVFPAVLEKRRWSGELHFRHFKTGAVIPVIYDVFRVDDPHTGQPINFATVTRDITELKRAEQKLLESHQALRELSASLQSVREDEQTRIARELHDELGQELTALRMDLDWIITKLPADQRSLVDKAEAMRALLEKTVSSVRRIAADLRPMMLDDLGFVPAVEWLLEDFSRRTGIQCQLHACEDELDLADSLATALFRMVQEALTNVAHHAEATAVTISIAPVDENIVLKIQDNGKGFSPETQRKPNSFGLLGMRERAYRLGGQVKISSQPMAGTVIEISIPWYCQVNESAQSHHQPGGFSQFFRRTGVEVAAP